MLRLICLTFLLHSIFLYAMFDIFFKTHIVNDLKYIPNDIKKVPAKRLVLFVGDGIRADSFFQFDERDKPLAPFLSQIIENGATWGVSHTQVPTESRPGHVALIAGFYEDPSAVFKGWKENPVPFDSVFNRSRATFAFGSPDIVSIFSHGASHIHSTAYKHEDEKFDDSAINLNAWVLEEFTNFMKNYSSSESLKKVVESDQVVFFLHLIGTDIAGHVQKPHSAYYKRNIRFADQIARNVYNLVESSFNDNSTAYIFTSDHGMTDWGSHGAGLPSETETPLVVWGSGVKKHTCQVTRDLVTACPSRKDVQQADITVLMSLLIGQPIPTNNIGILPAEYLQMNEEDTLKAYYLNAEQLFVHFNHKQNSIKSQVLSMFYRPFNSLLGDLGTYLGDTKLQTLTSVNSVVLLVKEVVRGIGYYQTYYQNFLLALVASSFFGLIILVLKVLLRLSNIFKKSRGKIEEFRLVDNTNYILNVAVIFTVILYLVQNLPFIYLLYNLVPVYLWCQILKGLNFRNLMDVPIRAQLPKIAVYVFGVEIMFFSFFVREVLSVAMLCLCLWPKIDPSLKHVPSFYKTYWMASCSVLAVFPLLPTIGTSIRIYLVLTCGLLWLITSVLLLLLKPIKLTKNKPGIIYIQMALVCLTIINVNFVDVNFTSGDGLSGTNQLVSFLVLFLSTCTIFFKGSDVISSFLSLSYSLGVPFLLFSTSHESFLPLFLSINLILWIILERSSYETRAIRVHDIPVVPAYVARPILVGDDFRRGLFFMFYLIFSFFAIGNIDSINSFDTNWVRCFITVFSPFKMMTLILLKTVIPFLLVACAFRYVVAITEAPSGMLILIVLLFCDAMGVQFLFCVRNTGSWLEIGRSISHYVIMEVIILFVILFYGLASLILYPRRCTKTYHRNLMPS